MDTGQQRDARQQQQAVAASLELIKSRMPETYADIQRRAKAHGNAVFALVRQGLRGEPNRFYAVERGHVVGTPFNVAEVEAELKRYVLQFGCSYLSMWGLVTSNEVASGAH